MAKVPGTPRQIERAQEAAEEAVIGQEPMMMAPLELVVHAANMAVRKVPTPDGTLTILQMLTPVGIMLSLKFDDTGIDALVRQLKGMDIVTKPGIILPS